MNRLGRTASAQGLRSKSAYVCGESQQAVSVWPKKRKTVERARTQIKKVGHIIWGLTAPVQGSGLFIERDGKQWE
jgi:hypothetical protein